MQTTLRVDGALYRKAKAQAALEGMTLTQFLEDAMRVRLCAKVGGAGPVDLPFYDSGRPFEISPERLKRLDEEAQGAAEVAKLLLNRAG